MTQLVRLSYRLLYSVNQSNFRFVERPSRPLVHAGSDHVRKLMDARRQGGLRIEIHQIHPVHQIHPRSQGALMQLLSALAAIRSVKTFRLKRLMDDLGMDSRQPALFHRALIREARQVVDLIDTYSRDVPELEARIADLEQEASVSAMRARRAERLAARVPELEGERDRWARQTESIRSQIGAVIRRNQKLSAESKRDLKIANDAVAHRRYAENIVAHLFKPAPFFFRKASEGHYEVVFPEFTVPGRIHHLVLSLGPGAMRLYTEPLDLGRMFNFPPTQNLTIDAFLMERVRLILETIETHTRVLPVFEVAGEDTLVETNLTKSARLPQSDPGQRSRSMRSTPEGRAAEYPGGSRRQWTPPLTLSASDEPKLKGK